VVPPTSRLALQTVAEIERAIGTVKSRVFRGRRLLAEALGNLPGASDTPIREANV
jgi:hypothetical protein